MSDALDKRLDDNERKMIIAWSLLIGAGIGALGMLFFFAVILKARWCG